MDAGFSAGMGWGKPHVYFVARLGEARSGKVVVLVAAGNDGRYLGHAIVRWTSDYAGFRERSIPEVHDLNASPILDAKASDRYCSTRRSASSAAGHRTPVLALACMPPMDQPSVST